MSIPIILAIDEGTTNAKAIAVGRDGRMLAKASVPLLLDHPRPGWAEQDPIAIWQAVVQAIGDCLARLPDVQVQGVAISNQRESVMIWERSSGRPLTPVVSWQCRRSQDFCQELAQSDRAALIYQTTGLPVDPLFPAAKVRGMLAALPLGVERAARGELCAGTLDSWLNWQFTAGQSFSTDYSNASRTQLFNIHQGCWDEALLAIFAVPAASLAHVKPSAAIHGYTQSGQVPGLAGGIPIAALIGDSHAALYGQGGNQAGDVKATYGTGSSLMLAMNHLPDHGQGLGSTVAWHDGQIRYALEGNITHTGAALSWVARLLGVSSLTHLSDMALSVSGNQGVFFVPALSGLGAPYWDSQARGLICGLTDAATPDVLARVGLESIAYQVADVFFAMERAAGHRLPALRVDGGATQNHWLMQFQADLLQRPLIRNLNAEVSALGAAYLAGKTLGWWPDNAHIAALPREVEYIEPCAETAQMHDNYKLWQMAVARARYQPE
ncbi:FGGY-family carbohydrate kinase [Acerihabitans sp. TG2]|uniref:FGGY family carbohydrate kinase n=1 Tax=Acerihabitans sp. TG2 TaxID=3096008 RepID=UPI002B234088|nr:FGGY-family carbohydrate kinase [Acerihabitans sp. TG2]MEA9389413.1 FGGY-family carbohydrate kinase [Acerihabitans sp. TG2]